MSVRSIRIHEGVTPDTDIVGVSRSFANVVYGKPGEYGGNRMVRAFLNALGHKATVLAERRWDNLNDMVRRYNAKIVDMPDDWTSLAYMEVQPPMSAQTVDQLAEFLDRSGIADPYQNTGIMYDQRPGHERAVREW